VRAFNPHVNDWETILSASTPSTNNNLSDAKALRFADNTSGSGGHSAWTGLAYWGLFAGVAWTADEAHDHLLDAEALWSPRWPIILAPAASAVPAPEIVKPLAWLGVTTGLTAANLVDFGQGEAGLAVHDPCATHRDAREIDRDTERSVVSTPRPARTGVMTVVRRTWAARSRSTT
jgi:hypothetical protein